MKELKNKSLIDQERGLGNKTIITSITIIKTQKRDL